MDALVYLLHVGSNAALKSTLCKALGLDAAPEYVRVSTLAPLSNQGYPEGVEGQLLSWSSDGLQVGVESDKGVPRAFVPWQNVAYVADGTWAIMAAIDASARADSTPS